MKVVEVFKYLRSVKSVHGNINNDTRSRIGMAKKIMFDLVPSCRDMWINQQLKWNWSVKLRLYAAIVIPTEIYACETWKRTAMVADRLDVFHRRCLRTILDTSWCDHATNEQVTRRAGMERLQDHLTTNLAAVVWMCVSVQNLTNFCPHALISNPNVPKNLFA